MPHNINTMAYYGDEPWHGLGVKLAARASAADMITAASLDWLVEKKPAQGARINKKGEATRYTLCRMPRHGEEQEILLGTVTSRYEPLQNKEAFEFFDPIVGEGKACFETAGALGDGERIWALAKMPGVIQVVRGDECMKYLLLSNRHDGQGAVTIKFTAVRVVCQNTLMLALENGQKAFRVRHSKSMPDRLAEVGEIMRITKEVYEKGAELFKKMATVSLKPEGFRDYLDLVFPRTDSQRKQGKHPEKWDFVREVLDTREDLQMHGVRGTLWGAYNAIARFEDYRQPDKEEAADTRLNRTWFGSGADVKLRALMAAQTIVSKN